MTFVRVQPPWQAKRETLLREEAETSEKYGFQPHNRPIEEHLRFGCVNLDKPSGPSSHEVTAWVKKILGVAHAGHGGTLEAVEGLGKSPCDRCPTHRT